MAIINPGRLRNIMVRGEVASESVATELIEEMDAQLEEALSEHPTHDRVALMEERILRAIAESEARHSSRVNQATAILLAGLALAVGIILGFG